MSMGTKLALFFSSGAAGVDTGPWFAIAVYALAHAAGIRFDLSRYSDDEVDELTAIAEAELDDALAADALEHRAQVDGAALDVVIVVEVVKLVVEIILVEVVIVVLGVFDVHAALLLLQGFQIQP